MFIVNLTYTVPLDEVDKLLDGHVEFLKECYTDGTFIASGRKVPRTGGIILARSESVEDLEEILERDPFWKNSVAEYDVVEFIPSMAAEGLEDLLENSATD